MEKRAILDNFEILKTIGKGGSCKVKLGRDIDTGKTFALKILKGAPELIVKNLKFLLNEQQVVGELDHESLVPIIDIRTEGCYVSKRGEKKTKAYAVIEYVSNGELFSVIFHTGPFDENLTRFYFQRLLLAVEYLHARNVAHRDIKPENLLLDEDLQLKITDFGFASLGEEGKLNSTMCGTPGYNAPEILTKTHYDGKKADAFSLGVVLFVMYSRRVPFKLASQADPFYKLFCTKPESFWNFHSMQPPKRVYSKTFKELVTALLSAQPDDRPTVQEIRKSPWFCEPVDESLALQTIQLSLKHMATRAEKEHVVETKLAKRKDFRSENADIIVDLCAPTDPDLRCVILRALGSARKDRESDFKLRVACEDEFASLLVALCRKAGAHIAADGDKQLELTFPLRDFYGPATMTMKVFKLDEEGLCGFKLENKNTPYFDYQHFQALILDTFDQFLQMA